MTQREDDRCLFDPLIAGVGGNVKTQMQQRQAAPPKPPAAKRMTLEAVTTGAERPPERLLIYGSGGIGKTTMLAELGGTIFIDTQDGSKRLNTARFPTVLTWQDVLDALDVLAVEQHSHRRVAIDLLDDVEQLIWADICRKDDKPNIEAYGYGGGYKVALGQWRIMLAKLERLRREKGMQVAFAAHVFIEKFNNPEGPDYDRYQLQLNKHAAGLLRGWCDNVLFAREVVSTTTDKQKRTRGVSRNIRVVHTIGTAAYYAKNRDNLPDTLPLDAGAYLDAVAASQPASADEVRAEIAQVLEGFTDAAYVAKAQKLVEDTGDDANKLLRILNKLRERLSTTEPQEQKTEETSNE